MVRVLWGAVCARRGPFSIGHGQYQGHWGEGVGKKRVQRGRKRRNRRKQRGETSLKAV